LPELLFELGVEEMPAKAVEPAIEKLRLSVNEGFARYGLEVGNGRSFGTPRRLGLLLADVPEGTADRLERVFGPPARVAMENADTLSPKGVAFVESQGPDVIRWFVEPTKRGETLCVERRIPGTPLCDLAPKIFLEALDRLSFPKVMRWGCSRETFVRPVRWILALLNEKILPIERYDLKSGGVSYPHRHKGFAPVRIPHPQDYVSLMEEGFVSVFPEDRKTKLLKQTRELLLDSEHLGELKQQAIEEVVQLTEWPRALIGRFDERFMALPGFAIEHVIFRHQKCLAVYQKNSKNILPKFVAVANLPEDDLCLVRQGFERVVRARLEDALFYFNQDLKRPLLERFEELGGILEHEKLGTLADKAERLEVICSSLSLPSLEGVAREKLSLAIKLMKCDLATQMVGEFPELQGRMGEEYARHFGYGEEVARVIHESTLPLPNRAELPESPVGISLSILEKLDTLTGFALIGLLPTAAQDPYALRRKALALVRIILGRNLPLDVGALFDASFAAYESRTDIKVPPGARASALSFVTARLESFLESNGYAKDALQAVLARSRGVFLGDLRKLDALASARQRGAFGAIGLNIKRIRNILPENDSYLAHAERLSKSAYELEEERALLEAFQRLESAIDEAGSSLAYDGAMNALEDLKDPLERFFARVMVNVEDRHVRAKRIALLAYGYNLVDTILDFSRLSLEKSS
jgi:glycyl-tRNA synthetase beta chain